MAHCFHHALASVRRYGGRPEDYQSLHDWFDQSKAHHADFRHRALRHHAEGIFALEAIFGTVIRNSDGRDVPVRLIGEDHVREDLGRIPSFTDWARAIQPQRWMMVGTRLEQRLDLIAPVPPDDGIGSLGTGSTPIAPDLAAEMLALLIEMIPGGIGEADWPRFYANVRTVVARARGSSPENVVAEIVRDRMRWGNEMSGDTPA